MKILQCQHKNQLPRVRSARTIAKASLNTEYRGQSLAALPVAFGAAVVVDVILAVWTNVPVVAFPGVSFPLMVGSIESLLP